MRCTSPVSSWRVPSVSTILEKSPIKMNTIKALALGALAIAAAFIYGPRLLACFFASNKTPESSPEIGGLEKKIRDHFNKTADSIYEKIEGAVDSNPTQNQWRLELGQKENQKEIIDKLRKKGGPEFFLEVQTPKPHTCSIDCQMGGCPPTYLIVTRIAAKRK